MMLISVALASYNGIKHIAAQLDSLRSQTLPPDEVIITDDCSTDGTFEFCESYIRENNLTGWKVFRNEPNLGVAKNFRFAISKCSGEYVFTCDQDDVWLPDKIEAMVEVMKSRPEIKLLVSNYIPMSGGKRLKVRLKNLERNDGSVIQYKLKDTWLDTLRPGCTYCFRRELAEMFEVFDPENRLHDEMLWLYAILQDSLWLLNRQLILFIRHGDNATDPFPQTHPNVEQRLKLIDEFIDWHERVIAASDVLKISSANRSLLRHKVRFLERRKATLAKRNIFCVALFVMMNFKYYPTFRNALSDVYAVALLMS